MHDDFLNHFPQQGGGQFFKGKVLADNAHEFLGVDGGGLRLVQFSLQGCGSLFQFSLLGFIISRQFHETLVADFAVYIVLIQPLDNPAHFGNAFLCLFKLLGGCGGLSLAADLVLLDKYTKTSCAKKCHAENSSQNVLIHTIGVVLTTENYCGSIIA